MKYRYVDMHVPYLFRITFSFSFEFNPYEFQFSVDVSNCDWKLIDSDLRLDCVYIFEYEVVNYDFDF